MSDRRLSKNINTGTGKPCNLSLKPIVLSDSKGRYLQAEVTSSQSPENKILWSYKSGSTTFKSYLWLKDNIDSLISKYHHLSVYIFTGTCDLTIRKYIRLGRRSVRSRYCELRPQHAVSLLKRHYSMIQRFLTRKGVKVTFLHCPLYSLELYNKGKGHPDPRTFKLDDKTLTENVHSVNRFIDEVNRQMGTYSPKLNEDLRRSRKSKKGSQRYSWNFKLLDDGIHPKPRLARSWLKSISRKIRKDCSGQSRQQ